MYFLKFFGSTSIEQVLDAMDYAVYVHDVEHILLDNLQFMLSGQGRAVFDRFEVGVYKKLFFFFFFPQYYHHSCFVFI